MTNFPTTSHYLSRSFTSWCFNAGFSLSDEPVSGSVLQQSLPLLSDLPPVLSAFSARSDGIRIFEEDRSVSRQVKLHQEPSGLARFSETWTNQSFGTEMSGDWLLDDLQESQNLFRLSMIHPEDWLLNEKMQPHSPQDLALLLSARFYLRGTKSQESGFLLQDFKGHKYKIILSPFDGSLWISSFDSNEPSVVRVDSQGNWTWPKDLPLDSSFQLVSAAKIIAPQRTVHDSAKSVQSLPRLHLSYGMDSGLQILCRVKAIEEAGYVAEMGAAIFAVNRKTQITQRKLTVRKYLDALESANRTHASELMDKLAAMTPAHYLDQAVDAYLQIPVLHSDTAARYKNNLKTLIARGGEQSLKCLSEKTKKVARVGDHDLAIKLRRLMEGTVQFLIDEQLALMEENFDEQLTSLSLSKIFEWMTRYGVMNDKVKQRVISVLNCKPIVGTPEWQQKFECVSALSVFSVEPILTAAVMSVVRDENEDTAMRELAVEYIAQVGEESELLALQRILKQHRHRVIHTAVSQALTFLGFDILEMFRVRLLSDLPQEIQHGVRKGLLEMNELPEWLRSSFTLLELKTIHLRLSTHSDEERDFIFPSSVGRLVYGVSSRNHALLQGLRYARLF